VTQFGLLLAIGAMAFQQPARSLQLLAINALIVAILSATQDIAGDAYRTDVLEPEELGAGASIWVLGYRIALLVTSALALILADFLPWSVVYGLMAALMSVGLITTLWAPEPRSQNHPPESFLKAVYLPFQEFFSRLGTRSALIILLFILLYRLADALVGNMATPFLLDIGFSKTEIGAIQGTFGFFATTIGVIAGGAITTQLGINRSLWVFGILQILSNLGYFSLSVVGKYTGLLLLAVNIENFCTGLVTAAFVAYLMSLCNHSFTATQYALLSSLMATASIVLAAPAGDIAKAMGWAGFFLLSMAAGLPSLLLLPVVAPWNRQLPYLAVVPDRKNPSSEL
jgi:PAT family beta-lactamase induction signal transducer AmpG